jgi:uncharacterized protein (DUF58 family)
MAFSSSMPDWETLRRLENFQLAAQIIVEGLYAGQHRSPFYDASAEFADYRPYVVGDEIRALDWRAYARTDRDYVRRFRKETEMCGCLVLDTSRSMSFRDEPPPMPKFRRGKSPTYAAQTGIPPTKAEYAAYLLAALAYLMVRQNDRAALALGSTHLQTFLPPSGTRTHLLQLLATLERAQPDGTTHLGRLLTELAPLVPRQGVLVIASDLLAEDTDLLDSLARFAFRGWRILLLHILTPTEIHLTGNAGRVRIEDAESIAMLDADLDLIHESYTNVVQMWLNEWEATCKARGIAYTRLTTDTPFSEALQAFLTLRAR